VGQKVLSKPLADSFAVVRRQKSVNVNIFETAGLRQKSQICTFYKVGWFWTPARPKEDVLNITKFI
jgi:hypothetical protein